jgi:hypothetical protein
VIGYRNESGPRWGLVRGGFVLLGVSYLLPLTIVASLGMPNESSWLAIPLVGPYITMGRMTYFEKCDETFGCRPDDGVNALAAMGLVTTGLMQAGGATMILLGLALHKEEKVPIYAVVPAPLGAGGYGLSAIRRF